MSFKRGRNRGSFRGNSNHINKGSEHSSTSSYDNMSPKSTFGSKYKNETMQERVGHDEKNGQTSFKRGVNRNRGSFRENSQPIYQGSEYSSSSNHNNRSSNSTRGSRNQNREFQEYSHNESDFSAMTCDEDIKTSFMDEESEKYFDAVFEKMHEPFESDEEADLFLEIVIEQMEGKECQIATTNVGRRIFLKFLELNNKQVLIEKMATTFKNDIEVLSSKMNSSIVLQAFLINCLKYLPTGDDADDKDNCITDFVLAVANFCIENFPDVLDHQYQNYILKTIIHVLSGNTWFSLECKKHPINVEFITVPQRFEDTFDKLSLKILATKELQECFKVDIFSILIQHLLKASSHFPNICQNIIGNILENMDTSNLSDGELPSLLTDTSASYIIQTVVELSNRKQWKIFRKKIVHKNLIQLLEHKKANHILRVFIRSSPNKKLFEKLFDKLEPHLCTIFNLEHDSLLVSIADTCLKFDVCQARFVIALKNLLQCLEGEKQEYFFLCTLHMLTYDIYIQAESDNTATISLNGSLLVQRLLKFSKPIRIVMAIINLSFDNLKRIACDPKGCHVIDEFMKSKFVGEKNKDKFISKLQDMAITLACSPYGSRCIDAIWTVATLKQKMILAEGLAKSLEILSTNRFGKFICSNLGLPQYKNRLQDWKQVQLTQDKKHKLFRDILSESEMEAKKIKLTDV